MSAEDRAHCATLAAWLQALTQVGVWSLIVSAVALLKLWLTSVQPSSALLGIDAGLAAVVLLGIAERYFALRLALDRALFDALACGHVADLNALDAGLALLQLRRRSPATRPLAQRSAGARRIAGLYLALTLVQTLVFLISLLTQ